MPHLKPPTSKSQYDIQGRHVFASLPAGGFVREQNVDVLWLHVPVQHKPDAP
jgi:hypothetical protein